MRIQKRNFMLSIAIIALVTGLWYWCSPIRSSLPAEGEILNKSDLSQSLDSALADYLSKRGDFQAQSLVGAQIARTQPNLWEACAKRVVLADSEERLALAHIASFYFAKGKKEEEELFTLLRSSDEDLVRGLLVLISDTSELGKNGEWHLDKPLGGASVPPHISAAYRQHPELQNSISTAMGRYGRSAKNEGITLLHIILSSDPSNSFIAKAALYEVDPKGLFLRFGLDLEEPLSEEQREQIKEFIDGRREKVN